MPLAEGSDKTAVKYEHNVRITAEIGQAYSLTLEILQGEIGSRQVKRDLGHGFPYEKVDSINFGAHP